MQYLRNNLPLLYDFYNVAKSKSFSKAAEKNWISPSNLSRSVKNLEEQLKLKLINSSNKGIELTLDGEKLFKQLDGMFNSFDDYKFDLSKKDEEITGKITIGTTRNIADNKLASYLSKFSKRYPAIKIKILTDNATNLNEYLTKHKIDVLIDYLPHINSSEQYEIEVKAIGKFETCFACSDKFYEKKANKIKTLSDLRKYDLVIPGSSRRRQLLDEFLQANNIKLNPKVEMPDSKLMAEFAIQNNYIGYFIKEEMESYNLVELDLDMKLPINSIGIIYSKNTINNITKSFIELVLENTKN